MGLIMGPWMWMGPISMLLWVLVAVAVLLALRASGVWRRPDPPSGMASLEILDARYARGEITREEYLRIREDITGKSGRG